MGDLTLSRSQGACWLSVQSQKWRDCGSVSGRSPLNQILWTRRRGGPGGVPIRPREPPLFRDPPDTHTHSGLRSSHDIAVLLRRWDGRGR